MVTARFVILAFVMVPEDALMFVDVKLAMVPVEELNMSAVPLLTWNI